MARKAKKKAPARKAVKKAVKKAPAKKAAPKGHIAIAPGITANDAAASVKWYCDVLGFRVIERWEHDGVFHGAQIGSGGVIINVGQDDWKMGRDRVKGQGTRMYIDTSLDIDKYAAAVRARGGVLDQEPSSGWGARMFAINDPDGFKITFMKRG